MAAKVTISSESAKPLTLFRAITHFQVFSPRYIAISLLFFYCVAVTIDLYHWCSVSYGVTARWRRDGTKLTDVRPESKQKNAVFIYG